MFSVPILKKKKNLRGIFGHILANWFGLWESRSGEMKIDKLAE